MKIKHIITNIIKKYGNNVNTDLLDEFGYEIPCGKAINITPLIINSLCILADISDLDAKISSYFLHTRTEKARYS